MKVQGEILRGIREVDLILSIPFSLHTFIFQNDHFTFILYLPNDQ